MTRRALWMFLLALLLAGLAAWFANHWLQTRMESETAGPSSQKVVVAALKISFAQKIEAVHIKAVDWPISSLPEGTFQDPQEVIGKVANQTILPNEPILKERIAEHLGGSTLSAFITPSKRAVSVRVDDVTGVGGFVLPGNLVDVLQVSKEQGSRLVLENIKVLAVDQEASPDRDKPAIVRAVTLELTPTQAETLVAASQTGTIHLALRNPLDNSMHAAASQSTVPTTGSSPPSPPVIKRADKEIHRPMLTIIRGDKATVYEGNLLNE